MSWFLLIVNAHSQTMSQVLDHAEKSLTYGLCTLGETGK